MATTLAPAKPHRVRVQFSRTEANRASAHLRTMTGSSCETITPSTASVNSLNRQDRPSPIVPDEFEESGEELGKLYAAIGALLHPDAEDGGVAPTGFAVDRACEVLEQVAYGLMQSRTPFPKGYVADDDRGGIRIEWWNGQGSCASLAVGSDDEAPSYFFVKHPLTEKGSLDKDLNSAKFAIVLAAMFKDG